jgi:hypothetical protein
VYSFRKILKGTAVRHSRFIALTASAMLCAWTLGCGGADKSPVSPACALSIFISTQQFGPAGGSANVVVSAPVGCRWTVTSAASWIAIQGNGSGTGDGAVTLAIAASTEASPRTAAIEIAGEKRTVNQTGR